MAIVFDRVRPRNANFVFARREQLDAYKERYPKGLDLSPDSETHKKLLQYCLSMLGESSDVMQVRYPTWREIDRKLTAYIDLSQSKFDKEKTDATLKRENPLKPVSIVIPQAYATKEILITYMMSAFLQDPIFRYGSAGDPNDVLGNIILESVISQQAHKQGMGLNLITMWNDDATYGFGGVMPYWKVIRKNKYRGGEITERIAYEGNDIPNLDPYNSYPDPGVPITNVTDMAYFFFVSRENGFKLLKEEQEDSSMFNVRYLEDQKLTGTSSFFNGDPVQSGRFNKTGLDNTPYGLMAKPVDVTWGYVWLIPKELGIGDNEYPELWLIAIMADRVIIKAEKLELDMDEIPICTISTKHDGHTTIPPSSLEVEYPIQEAIDFLWNSHVANVRKAVNNMLVVDPYLVNINDIMDTSAGMVARMRAAAWGRNLLKEAVMQVPVNDVTQNNIVDIGFLKRFDEEFMGTASQMKGVQERRGERVSSAEARDTRRSALLRREKDAKIAALQGHKKIAEWLASNTLQFLSGEGYVKLVGRFEELLRKEYGQYIDTNSLTARVVFDKLDVDFDVLVNDGTVQGGEYADTWVQLINLGSSHPEVFQGLDFVRVWKHVARLLGVKNPEDFMKKAPRSRTAPMEQIDKGVQQGNLVPLNEVA